MKKENNTYLSICREIVINTYANIYRTFFSHRNVALLFVPAWIELKNVELSKMSQTENDKGHTFYHMWKS
jgi:hypothetical protein